MSDEVLDLPHAKAAERAIVGAILLDGITAFEQCQRLDASMLFFYAYRAVFSALKHLLESGQPGDLIALSAELRLRGDLEKLQGMPFLYSLTEGIPKNFDCAYHVEAIIEKWKLRTGMEICARFGKAFQEEDSSARLLADLQGEVFDAMQEMTNQSDPHVRSYTFTELDAAMDYTLPATGYSFGCYMLDEFTSGMQAGEVTVVGARSGVGKTSLVCQAIAKNCSKGIPMDVFSLEMTRGAMLRRLWAIEAKVPYFLIQRKKADAWQKTAIKEAAHRIAEWPLRIHDDGELTLGQIAALARLSARRNGMKIMAVDYAQIVNADGKDERTKVSNVSRTLTKLAKKENVHLMLLSQLRKVPREQYSHAPHIGDLRETGQLENDAHAVVLLHRGWDEPNSRIANEAELIVPKQRNGETGAVQARFDGSSLTFV